MNQEMDEETLEVSLMRGLIREAKAQNNCNDSKAVCKLTPRGWGTNMSSVDHVFEFTLELQGSDKITELVGYACISELPGTEHSPRVTGKAGEWKFKFCL